MNTVEDKLKQHIGEEIKVCYIYGTNEYDDAYDRGVLTDVGNGYIVLDVSNYDNYEYNTAVINLVNVTGIGFGKKKS